MRIRQGNDFIFLWAIERSGEPEDFSNAENIRLHFKNFDCVGEVKSFQIVDGNIVRVEVSPEWASRLGAYRLILSYEFEDLSYSDGDRKCVVDVLAFSIVSRTSEAHDITEMAKTTDIMIGLKGDKGEKGDKGDAFVYSDFTVAQLELLKGEQGIQGEIGPKGNTGEQGPRGLQGPKGDSFVYDDFTPTQLEGLKGPQGIQGPKGEVGPKGDIGPKGDTGAKGDTGLKGDIGNVGKSAYQVWIDEGNTGTISAYLNSLKGEKGDTGEKGDKGDTGEQGIQGTQGPKGDKGDDGYTPVKGVDYFDGEQGPRGDKGETGEQGIQGEQGEQGEQGIQGIQGEQGSKGDKGDQGDTGTKGDKGDKGDPGSDANVTETNIVAALGFTPVSSSRVLTDVPSGAKFTDTVTTVNGKTGVITKADIVALGIPAQDTVYSHPTTHPASIITQTEEARFVTDIEKADWTSKETPEGSQTKATTALTSAKDYVDGKVLTDVPLNAKFTDTIYTHPTSHPYSMITGAPTSLPANGGDSATVNGKTVAVNVPANARFTDTIVNVSHLLPRSGGTIVNYAENLTTTTGVINLNSGNVFYRNATANTTFNIMGAKAGAHSFTLIITMGATVRQLIFPASVKWQDGEVPDMTEANKIYILTFMTINSGTTWFGMEGGSF